jgi:hypothetical protein
MPREPHDERYDEVAFAIRAREPRASDAAVVKMLREWAQQQRKRDVLLRSEPPSARTVSRIRQRWKALDADEQREYTEARWPEAKVSGALPWEAAAALLEFRRYLADHPQLRLTVRGARWFWWVTQSAPGAPFEYRWQASSRVATYEVLGAIPPEELRRVEAFLMYRPWTREGRAVYEDAIARGDILSMKDNAAVSMFGVDVDREVEARVEYTGQSPQAIRRERDAIVRAMESDEEGEHNGEQAGER